MREETKMIINAIVEELRKMEERINKRFEQMDQCFDKIDACLESMKLENRIEEL